MLPRWYSTALRLMNSSAATSRLDIPFPTRWATSVSRLVSARTDWFFTGLPGRRQAASSSSVRARNGAAQALDRVLPVPGAPQQPAVGQQQPGHVHRALSAGGFLAAGVDLPGLRQGAALLG